MSNDDFFREAPAEATTELSIHDQLAAEQLRQLKEPKKRDSVLRHPLLLTVLGFALTAVVGQYLNVMYQRATKIRDRQDIARAQQVSTLSAALDSATIFIEGQVSNLDSLDRLPVKSPQFLSNRSPLSATEYDHIRKLDQDRKIVGHYADRICTMGLQEMARDIVAFADDAQEAQMRLGPPGWRFNVATRSTVDSLVARAQALTLQIEGMRLRLGEWFPDDSIAKLAFNLHSCHELRSARGRN